MVSSHNSPESKQRVRTASVYAGVDYAPLGMKPAAIVQADVRVPRRLGEGVQQAAKHFVGRAYDSRAGCGEPFGLIQIQ